MGPSWLKWVILPVGLLLATAGAFAVTKLPVQGDVQIHVEAAAQGPPPIEVLDRSFEELLQRQQEDEARPRHFGPHGDFEVVASRDQTHPALFCADGVQQSQDQDFISSELDMPGISDQVVCADGTVAATWSTAGRLSYFEGRPKLFADAPVERLELSEIDGHRALIVSPPSAVGPFFLYLIVRASSTEEPGILLALIGDNREHAIERASLALSLR
jgi:hypothetical protein